jgi:hypothetical protein
LIVARYGQSIFLAIVSFQVLAGTCVFLGLCMVALMTPVPWVCQLALQRLKTKVADAFHIQIRDRLGRLGNVLHPGVCYDAVGLNGSRRLYA